MLMPEHLHSPLILIKMIVRVTRRSMIDDSGTSKVMLMMSNTRCAYCSRVIEQKLKNMAGIVDISVSYLADKILVRYNPSETNTNNT